MAAFDPLAILRALSAEGVAFIVIGQAAAVLHGHPETTIDVDILVRQDIANAERLTEALIKLQATHAAVDAPPDKRDFLGWRHIRQYNTLAGPLDVVPSAAGVGTFADVLPRAQRVPIEDFEVLVASLDDVIASKEAANRPQDQRRPPSLRAFRERQRRRDASETSQH